jgi:hypothetical protein
MSSRLGSTTRRYLWLETPAEDLHGDGNEDNLPGRMEVARLSRAVTLVSCPHQKEVNEARLFDREGA